MPSATDDEKRTELSMTAIGFTLIALIVNIGVTVAFGVEAVWWGRLAAGVGTSLVLLLVLALVSRRMRALRRAARWVTAYSPRRE